MYQVTFPVKSPKKVIVLMDTTYWGKGFGVMVFRDALSGENILKYYVKHETNALYRQGIAQLQSQGYTILAIVCDGRRGLIPSLAPIPVQMCQFHQSAIVKRYITSKPKSTAAIELKQICRLMIVTDRACFEGALEQWFTRWGSFINERKLNPITGKTYYAHRRVRSAYRSLKFNSKWLFTWYDHIELGIPNTTNALEGHFTQLKTKLNNHNGLNLQRKKKFIDDFLKV